MNQCYKCPTGVGRAAPRVYNKGVNKGDRPVNNTTNLVQLQIRTSMYGEWENTCYKPMKAKQAEPIRVMLADAYPEFYYRIVRV